ncbi:ferrous iron transport protein B [Bacteriovorax stolpii]|uniref:ferrous iron transport protein B n=1 Tax=Bacteriovorax stolpii TaxID=960 RepID=UPI001157638E|nr:ferrous iron transport protein B [Bacteriovorax stolpii]QDK43070.1 ferrous iron transport protein B [Bacteriovorax stolpii]
MENVLLVGFPNSGKSTIFNMLTGQLRKVSNYSGVTVDSANAELISNSINDKKISVVDLPGVYNLVPTSLDEGVTTTSLIKDMSKYKAIAMILDLDRFEASLSLLLAVKEILPKKNIIVIVNKNDHLLFTAEHAKKLEIKIGYPVLSISAINDDEKELDNFIRKFVTDKKEADAAFEKIKVYPESTQYIPELKSQEHFVEVAVDDVVKTIKSHQAEAREIINGIYSHSSSKTKFTEKLDAIMLHKFWGSLIFIAIFYIIFHAIYSWAGPIMDLTESGVGALGDLVGPHLPEGLIRSVVIDGVFAGVGGVIVFLPQIMILFFLLSLLEQSGYISRAAVLTDKVMGTFGLNGKAFLPYMSGFACAIPAIMAARSIPDHKERACTIMTIPMITCSARLPVYVLLIGTFIPSVTYLGFLNSQALAFFFLYFLGSFMALIIAKIFRLTIYKGETSNFIIDLPHYEKPSFRFAARQALRKGKVFLKKAGTIILGLSILIWILSTFPGLSEEQTINKTPEEVSALTLENSYLGQAGKLMEPVLKPMGMNWKMGVGVLVAFGARELFVSTLGTVYALGDVDEESSSLRDRLKSEVDPATGKPVFNTAVAWSLLIFFVFALQCISTLAILRREMGSWKYPAFMFTYMGLLGYAGATIAYQLLK